METHEGSGDVWRTLGPWRHRAAGVAVTIECNGERRRIALLPDEGDWYRLQDPSQAVRVHLQQSGGELRLSTGDGRQLHANGGLEGAGVYLEVDGVSYHFCLAAPPESAGHRHGQAGGAGLEAPMPGVLVKVHVREGQAVAAHQPLLVLEAMKMEHVIAAPSAGVVRRIPFSQGAMVPAGATLVEFEAEERT
jgi:3-methylcrotonyl-CoA carboxylase alpha subunit